MNIRDTLARKFNQKINETLNLYIRKPRPQEVAIGPRWTRTWLIEGVDATTREIPAAYASFLPYHGAMVCIENQFQFFQFSLACFLKVTRCCIHLRTSLLRSFDGDSASTAPSSSSSSSSSEELVSRAGSRTCPLHRANFPEFKFGQNTNERVV